MACTQEENTNETSASISDSGTGDVYKRQTPDSPVAAAECEEKKLYAIQFHPEVLHTQEGTKMLHNFIYEVDVYKRQMKDRLRR